MLITRKVEFSASHVCRLPQLSEQENRELFGLAANPHGHGHNYVLEVTVKGPIDQETGMVFDLVALDGIVEKEVLERFDYTNLNLDVEYFCSRVPTTENVCERIYHLLDDKLQNGGPLHAASLARVRLEETSSNFFEYEGPGMMDAVRA